MITQPAPSAAQPIERAPMHVEALAMYDAVASGKHSALRAARVPS